MGQFTIVDSIGGCTIGNNCGIGAHSQLWSHIKYGDTLEGCKFLMEKPLIVGNDVWIGREAVILPGVKIGDGAVIGAQSVVTHDVPPYSIVAGNPARFIRRRFDDETVYLLLKLKWWDWNPEKITENLDFLVHGNTEKLKEITK